MYSGIRKQDEQWEGVTADYVGNRPHFQSTMEELGEIEDLSTPTVFSRFSVTKPQGVANQYLNTAQPDRRPEPPDSNTAVAARDQRMSNLRPTPINDQRYDDPLVKGERRRDGHPGS